MLEPGTGYATPVSDNNTRNVLQSLRENQALNIKLTYCHPLPSFPGDQKYVTHIQ